MLIHCFGLRPSLSWRHKQKRKLVLTTPSSCPHCGVAQAIAMQSPVPGIASEAEAIAGTDNTTIMTPLRVNQVSGSTVSAHPGGRLNAFVW